MRVLPVATCILLLIASMVDAAPTTNPATASFRIVVDDGSGTSYGSGTAIGPNLVITNSHVVDHKLGPARVMRTSTGQVWQGRVVAGNRSADVAVIELAETVELPYVELGEDPQPGDEVRVFGYGQSGQLAGGAGQRNAKAYGDNATTAEGFVFFESSVITEPGDSGSGVFDRQGQLVGMNWGGDGTNSMFVPVTCIRKFLRGVGGRLRGGGRALFGPRQQQMGGQPGCPDGRCPVPSLGGGPAGRTLQPVANIEDSDPPPPAPAQTFASPPVLPGPDLSEYAKKADLAALEDRLTQRMPPPPDLSGVALKTDIPPTPDLSNVATRQDLIDHAAAVAKNLAGNQQLVDRLKDDLAMVPGEIQKAQADGQQNAAQIAVSAVKGILEARVTEAGGALSYGHILAIGAAGLFGMTPLAVAGWLATRGLAQAVAVRNSSSGPGGATTPFRT